MKHLQFSKEDYIGTITLQRPDVMNALNYETLQELSDLVEQIHHDRDIRVVVIRGEGKAFCVGADLKERMKLTEQEVRRNVHKISRVFEQIENLPQPTIAAMHGYAFGGGFELALACDLRYAQDTTKMGLTEVSLGIIPGAGGTVRLTQLVGKAKAKELILMAQRFDAKEGEALGIIQATTNEDVHDFAVKQAQKMTKLAPLAVVQAKYAINRAFDTDTRTGADVEAKAYEVLIPTEDRIEALRAFQEKRAPHFKGQ
ncbi:enoyl-CoA hydratase-related protein [Caldalkalibacillus salinus]|uniref:enoyl-CoA hydratase-related protein n=1 Tax=Caldalkalibacillus salinus TaxID=2803787 RepID=UPI001921917C|nr:enoyl-CoA hydratase-related protein [Caldalkalibacillus salinus]